MGLLVRTIIARFGLEVPLIRIYNNCMMNEMNKDQHSFRKGDILCAKSDVWYHLHNILHGFDWFNEDDIKNNSKMTYLRKYPPAYKKNEKVEVFAPVKTDNLLYVISINTGEYGQGIPLDFAKDTFIINSADQARNVLRKLR